MNQSTFYALTTIHYDISTGINRTRSVGIFNSKAIYEYVGENIGDIYENGYYNYAIVEEFPFALYPLCRERTWFVWDMEVEGFISCAEPDFHDKHTSHYAKIG